MPVKSFRPLTPSLRYKTVSSFEEITRSHPEKSLVEANKKSGGRNNMGRITSRRRGGGHRRHYRVVDFQTQTNTVFRPGLTRLNTIRIVPPELRCSTIWDGEKRYILGAPRVLKLALKWFSGPDADVLPGNALPLQNIPQGTDIHNVELQPGKGGQLGRSAGTEIQIMAKEGKFAQPPHAFRRGYASFRRRVMPRSAQVGKSGTRKTSFWEARVATGGWGDGRR